MPTAESVKAKLQGLIDKANGVTGKVDNDLTNAVNSLCDGFGVGEPKLQEKTATENGEVTADEGYDGLSKVIVNVEASGGGEQPKLFAPIVTAGLNQISWKNDTRNGGFSVSITATIDGEIVTSPLTITEDMNGKTLTVTASAENFESNTEKIEILYTSTEVTGFEVYSYLPLTENDTLTQYYRNGAWCPYNNGNVTNNITTTGDGTNQINSNFITKVIGNLSASTGNLWGLKLDYVKYSNKYFTVQAIKDGEIILERKFPIEASGFIGEGGLAFSVVLSGSWIINCSSSPSASDIGPVGTEYSFKITISET